MKKLLALILLGMVLPYAQLLAQTVPFPSTQPNWGQIGPWGHTNEGTNWDTSPFKPFIYKGIPFRAMQPMSFNPTRTEKYPLILFLHGAGEAGGSNNRQLTHGGRDHRDAVQSGEFEGFLLYPQSYYGSWGGTINDYVVEIINLYIRDNNVDPNRIYVHGLSGGGAGSWMMLQSHSKVFAAALPMSNALLSVIPDMPKFKHVPVWYAQGGLDKNPPPSAAEEMVSRFRAVGGNIIYEFFPYLGHGTWNSMYAKNNFFTWMLAQSKLNIHVFGGRTNFCTGETINVNMGITAGFDEYQWMKNNVVIPNSNTNEINNNGAGSYQVRFRRSTQWTAWSTPVVLQYGTPTATPIISLNGGTTFPALDGRTSVTLSAPDGYESYRWSTGATTQSITVSAAGSYAVSVTEFNGCASAFSAPEVVTTSNGAGAPVQPTSFGAAGTSETKVNLSWSYSTTNHKRFELYRALADSGPYTLIALIDKDIREYEDGELQANTTYHYRLRAINDNGGSSYAATEGVTFQDVLAPSIPTEFKIVSTSETSIALSWRSSVDNIDGLGSLVYDLNVNGQTIEINAANSNPFPNNLAVNKPGAQSTIEASNRTSAAALDGNLNTYWSSAAGTLEQQDWMYVDLLEAHNLNSVSVRWTSDYAVEYKIQISNDAVTWQDIKSVVGNNTTINNFTDITGTGRYVRVLSLLRRGNNNRVRIAELEVYGSRLDGQDQAYIGTVLSNLTPLTLHTLSLRSRDVSGNTSAFTPQLSALTVNDGLAYSYYEASMTTLNQLTGFSPVKTGKVRNFSLTPRNRNTDFAFVYEGFITISTGGLYTFYTRSVDGSRLYISDFLIVENDGVHSVQERSGQIVLNPGTYPIKVGYFKRGSGTLTLEVRYEGPGISKQLIPDAPLNSDFTPPAAPAAPTDVVATALSHKSIKIDWAYTSPVTTSGFEIYRSLEANGDFAYIGTVEGTSRTFTDTNLTPSTPYFYAVRAVGPTGESALIKGQQGSAGINYKFYPGAFTNLNAPYFNGTSPTKTGTLANLSLSPAAPTTTNYGFAFEGFITIATSGAYTFYTTSDDGSRLFIGETAVVNNDFNQGMTERSGQITLTAGIYPLTVLYRQGGGGSGLQMRYAGPGITKQLIPDDVLYTAFNFITATTQAIPSAPGIPSDLNVTAVSGKVVNVAWTAQPTTEGVKIFRSTNATTGFTEIGSVVDIVIFADSTVNPRTQYFYKVQAYNDGGESEQSGAVSVTTPNTPPTIQPVADINLLINTSLTLDIYGDDIDGDNLNFSFTSLPSFATFTNLGEGRGSLELNPTTTHAGNYDDIIVSVNDGFGGIARDTFNIFVNGNHSPVIQPITNQTLAAGTSITIQLSATDQNPADSVFFSAQNLPYFATIQNISSGSGVLTITPPLAERGAFRGILVLAEDGKGGTSSTGFDIVVNETKTNFTVSLNFNDRWDPAAPAPWNNFQRYPNANEVVSNLIDHEGANSGIAVTLETGWGVNVNGPVTGNNTGVFPDNVMKNFFYIWDNRVQSIKISSLNQSLIYSFEMHGGTTNASVTGPTRYTIGTQTALLQPYNNTANVATIDNVIPDENGNVWLKVQTGPGANFSYLNGLRITGRFDDGNPPAAPSSLTAGMSEQLNSVILEWQDNSPSEDGYKVYRSLTDETNYQEIASIPHNSERYEDLTIGSNRTYFYKVQAFNGYGDSEFSPAVSITTPRTAPAITMVDSVSVEASKTLTVNVTATDSENEAITLSVTNMPSFVTFNSTGSGTANLVISPLAANIGQYVMTVNAATVSGYTSSKDLLIVVTEKRVKTVYVNFNVGFVQGAPWNNTNLAPLANATFSNLADDLGANSGISLTLVEAWGGVNTVGTVTGNNSGIFPDNVMRTFYWESTNSIRTIQMNGLDPTKVYDIQFFGSREGTGDRTTIYTIGSRSVSLNASNNTTQTADISGLVAPTGQLTIQVQRAPSSAFAYLNALVIRVYDQGGAPESPNGLTAKATSKTSVELKWNDRSYNETGFAIYRSTLANPTFQLVHTTGPDVSTYVNSGLQSNTTYFYKVRSITGSGESDYSNTESVTTILNYVYINCNSGYNQGQPWNNLNRVPIPGSRNANLRNDTWATTTIAFNVVEHPSGTTFGGANPFGVVTGNNSGIYPDNVIRTFYFTEATETARMVIDGLPGNYTYNFVFFGSRDGDGNRNTDYTIGDQTVTLNSSFNINKTVQINKIKPDQSGAVTIDMVSAAGALYGYINALVIEIYNEVPVVGGGGTARQIAEESITAETIEGSRIAVRPNPFEHNLTIAFENPAEINSFRASLVNQLGVTVHEAVFSMNSVQQSEQVEFTLENIDVPAGIYFLNIVTNTQDSKMVRVIKK